MLDFGFYNMDCMEGMKEFPDKYFDLAIVDPPYGLRTVSYTHLDVYKRQEQHDGAKANVGTVTPIHLVMRKRKHFCESSYGDIFVRCV